MYSPTNALKRVLWRNQRSTKGAKHLAFCEQYHEIANYEMSCGTDNRVEIELFRTARQERFGVFLALTHDTFGRVFRAIDPAEFEANFYQRTSDQQVPDTKHLLVAGHTHWHIEKYLHKVLGWALREDHNCSRKDHVLRIWRVCSTLLPTCTSKRLSSIWALRPNASTLAVTNTCFGFLMLSSTTAALMRVE